MLITKEMLEEKNACQDGLDWFVDRFPDGADHLDILAKLDREKTTTNYGEWLLVNFKLNGVYRRCYDNGQLSERVEYFDGKRNGIYQRYYAEGRLWKLVEYRHGKMHGPRRRYSNDGYLWDQIEYSHGVRI